MVLLWASFYPVRFISLVIEHIRWAIADRLRINKELMRVPNFIFIFWILYKKLRFAKWETFSRNVKTAKPWDQELFNWCIKWPHYTKFNVLVLDSSILKQSYFKNSRLVLLSMFLHWLVRSGWYLSSLTFKLLDMRRTK